MANKPYLICVDDEEFNQDILMEILEDDFDIKSFFHGQECIDYLASTPAEDLPVLILLDVNMPILNGLDTCRKMKADPRFKHILVVFVSALASAIEIEQGYAAGADDYITKPFEGVDLVERINYLLKS